MLKIDIIKFEAQDAITSSVAYDNGIVCKCSHNSGAPHTYYDYDVDKNEEITPLCPASIHTCTPN